MSKSQITATEFRRHLVTTLMRANRGETIVITYRGHPIMKVRPPARSQPIASKQR